MVGAPILAVVLVVTVLIVVKLATGSPGAKSGQAATAADSRVISQTTSVPAAVLNTVGIGSIKGRPTTLSGPALIADGKPRLLYVGAEYCPYCAAERWSVVVALSRFGTFTDLGQTASSPSDTFPSTPTLTFHGASYRSDYIAFTGKELQSNRIVNGKPATLDKLSAADQTIFARVEPEGSIPVLDIGGKYLFAGASYDPAVLQGSTRAQIAAALSDPTSSIAKGVDGTANVITASICAVTKDRPSAVCTTPGVTTAAAALSNG